MITLRRRSIWSSRIFPSLISGNVVGIYHVDSEIQNTGARRRIERVSANTAVKTEQPFQNTWTVFCKRIDNAKFPEINQPCALSETWRGEVNAMCEVNEKIFRRSRIKQVKEERRFSSVNARQTLPPSKKWSSAFRQQEGSSFLKITPSPNTTPLSPNSSLNPDNPDQNNLQPPITEPTRQELALSTS